MERRRYKRKTLRLNAESITGDTGFAVFIENLSESGIYMITSPSKTLKEFSPETKVNLKFKLPSKEVLSLRCKVIWSHKASPDSPAYSVGLEIIKPPEKYIKFVRALR